jgi:hypothetical protein
MVSRPNTYKRISPARRFQILTDMSDHIEPDGEKHIKYKEGVDDDVLAEKWGLPVKTIQRLRRNTFGTFHNRWNRFGKSRKVSGGSETSANKHIKALTKEIVCLQNEVAALRGQVSSIQDHMNIPARPTPRPSTDISVRSSGDEADA